MKQPLFLLAIAAYLLSSFYPNPVLKWVVSVLSLLIIIVVFASVPKFARILGILFLATGTALLAASGASWTSFILAFGNMLNILSLFALIPLIAIPIELGKYADRVQDMIRRRVNHSWGLYTITSFLSYVMSSFMNLAALPMMYHMIRPSLDLYAIEHKDRFMSRSITHGYSMPVLWTPVAPIVGVVVEMTGVRWSAILPVVIPFSLLGLLLDWIMGSWNGRRSHGRIGQAVMDEATAARESAAASEIHETVNAEAYHPVQIFIAILVFNLLISVMERYTHTGFLLLVCMAVIPFAFLWALLLRKGKRFLSKVTETLPNHLVKMKDQFYVFLSAGFMISAIQVSGAGHSINAWLGAVKNIVGADIFVLLIPLIPLALAFVGLHPAVGLALTAESMKPAALGISPELAAIAMLLGSATAFLMGPYNATAGMMSNLIGTSSYKVSNWNAPFTGLYLLMAMILLLILKKGG